MCRLLGYFGSKIPLEQVLCKPEHSLIKQSYQPQEMTAGLLNADGFGIGWYDQQQDHNPFTYKGVLPIWNDANLPQLARYIQSSCYLGYVRSATSSLSVDMINCQPFTDQSLLFVHNGFIDDFRQTLYRPIRNHLSDQVYQRIEGTTDSEHIFALILHKLQQGNNLQQALTKTISKLNQLAKQHQVGFSANIIVSNGTELAASRYSNRELSPTLYYFRDYDATQAIIIASEPMFPGEWASCPEKSLISLGENLEVNIQQLP